MSITQTEYKYLMSLAKEFVESDTISLDESWSRDVVAQKSKEAFIIHYRRSSIVIEKFSYHKTYRKSIPLLRFCSSVRHTNPDGEVLNGPHVHIYTEDYSDRFAYPVKEIGVDEASIEKGKVLQSFLKYCNIISYPDIQSSLF